MIRQRVERIQNALEPRQGALVTSLPNRFYLTGFETSAGSVLITKEQAYFLIDFRYVEKAKQTVDSCTVLLSDYKDGQIGELCKKHGVTELLTENDCVSVERFAHLQKNLPDLHFPAENGLAGWLKDLRCVKTPGEVELIRQAQKLTDDTFTYICSRIAPGRTERDVMLDMEFFMRRAGSEGVSFDFIVVSGKNSSLPHGVPTDKKIENGDFLTMDFGAVVKGYHSDMTRTVAVGQISEEQRRVYDTVFRAQAAGIAAVKPGVICSDVDKVSRDIIYSAGYEGCFGHGLGHSVGVEIHESPRFSPACKDVLKQGTIMTVEPGVYLENKFGVRIEDMVWVTENGCEDLTKSPRELIIL